MGELVRKKDILKNSLGIESYSWKDPYTGKTITIHYKRNPIFGGPQPHIVPDKKKEANKRACRGNKKGEY